MYIAGIEVNHQLKSVKHRSAFDSSHAQQSDESECRQYFELSRRTLPGAIRVSLEVDDRHESASLNDEEEWEEEEEIHVGHRY